jgi:hypothetical protein
MQQWRALQRVGLRFPAGQSLLRREEDYRTLVDQVPVPLTSVDASAREGDSLPRRDRHPV